MSILLLEDNFLDRTSFSRQKMLFCQKVTELFIIVFARYVAPEYACTGMLNEKSDVYSFGILIMEIITGRSPVEYSRPKGEVSF